MRTVLLIALVVAAAACHHGPRLGSEPVRRLGSYAFRISISGQDPIDGVLTIERDTVLVEAAGQSCRRDRGGGPHNMHSFSCFPPPGMDEFGLSVDSNRPALSEWSAMQRVMRTRQVCARYTVTERGQRVCAETRNENYFVDARVGGRLRFTAVDTARALVPASGM